MHLAGEADDGLRAQPEGEQQQQRNMRLLKAFPCTRARHDPHGSRIARAGANSRGANSGR